jgi:CBS domain-containing protein
MKVKDIMTPGVECVRPSDTLRQAADKMRRLDVGPMPVCGDNDRIVGMLTDRDITIRATAEGKDPKTAKVEEAMSPDVIWCFEDQELEDAARLMREHQVRRVLVMNRDKRLVGIVSLGDLAKEAAREHSGETLQEVSEPSEPRR